MVLGCVASTAAAPATSAVTIWISLPPRRLYTSTTHTTKPTKNKRKKTEKTNRRVMVGKQNRPYGIIGACSGYLSVLFFLRFWSCLCCLFVCFRFCLVSGVFCCVLVLF